MDKRGHSVTKVFQHNHDIGFAEYQERGVLAKSQDKGSFVKKGVLFKITSSVVQRNPKNKTYFQ